MALIVVCGLLWLFVPPLRAQPAAPAGAPFLITAERVTFDTRRRIVTAEGSVDVSSDGRRLLADRMIYEEPADRLTAEGNVVLLEPTGEAFFGERLEVSGDLRDAVVVRLGALLGERSRLAAREGTRSGGRITVLEDAVFSPCELCPESERPPLWQIRARTVEHDSLERTVTYRDARFELLGVPVMYTPYFSHPDPTVDRRTGFLTPSFGSDSVLGLTLETPFFLELAPNRDLTFNPLFTTDEGVLLGLEYRELREPGLTRLGGNITYTDAFRREGEPDRGSEWRGNIEADGRYRLAGLDAGFDLRWTSDESFLRRYDLGDSDVLESRAFLQRLTGPDFWSLSAYSFQGLREDDDQDAIPVVLPLAESRLRSSPRRWGDSYTLDTSLAALTRAGGLDSRRLTTEGGWELPGVGAGGDLRRLRLSLRGDVFNYEGNPETFGSDGGNRTKARLLPRATIDWSLPLIGDTGAWQHVVEPVVMATAAPSIGDEDDIPNEDSQVFELDETNLFEPDRFTGYDRFDDGVRIAYGGRFASVGPGGLSVSGVLGQSYQWQVNDAFPSGSGVNNNFSDIVGRLDFRPSPILDLAYRFRLDNESLQLRRSDVGLGLGAPRLRFTINYLELSDDPSDLAPDTRKEFRAGIRLQALDSLAVAAQTRIDVAENEPISHMFGVLYTNPCLVLVAGIERRFTTRGELDDETTFKVRVTLTDLGGGGAFGG